MQTQIARYRIGVVIPYYQRKPDLLSRALNSIGGQTLLSSGQCSIQVVIVDDSSPLPAADELSNFTPSDGLKISIERQPNGGAGAARNAALAMLDDDINVIAFLDSDDMWVPNHLSRAIAALESGADFYFCDAQRNTAKLSENASQPSWFIDCLHPIPGTQDLYWYKGPFDLAVVKGMVLTPTIVHWRRRNSTARFPSRYFRFGEDQYYWLEYLAEGGSVAYSSAIEVICGQGVNIFAGNIAGSEGQRLCILDEIAYRKDALATLHLSSEARKHMESKLAEAGLRLLKQGFWQLHDDKGRWLWRSICKQPSLILQFPRAMLAWFSERQQIKS